MAKTKKADTAVITTTNSNNELVIIEVPIRIPLLTQEFSNGDMNTLRDKINEIIRTR